MSTYAKSGYKGVQIPTGEKFWTETMLATAPVSIGDMVSINATGGAVSKFLDGSKFFGVVVNLGTRCFDADHNLIPAKDPCVFKAGRLSMPLPIALKGKPYGTYLKPAEAGWAEAAAGEEAFGQISHGDVEYGESDNVYHIDMFLVPKTVPGGGPSGGSGVDLARVTALEGKMTTAEGDINTLKTDMTKAKTDIEALEAINAAAKAARVARKQAGGTN